MATPRETTGAEGASIVALSCDELGAVFVEVVRTYAARRTGSSRDFWRKLLDEPDMIGLLNEYRRRAAERQEEYDAWLQLSEAGRL